MRKDLFLSNAEVEEISHRKWIDDYYDRLTHTCEMRRTYPAKLRVFEEILGVEFVTTYRKA